MVCLDGNKAGVGLPVAMSQQQWSKLRFALGFHLCFVTESREKGMLALGSVFRFAEMEC